MEIFKILLIIMNLLGLQGILYRPINKVIFSMLIKHFVNIAVTAWQKSKGKTSVFSMK